MKAVIKRYRLLFGGVSIPWMLLLLLFTASIIKTYVEVGAITMTASMIDASQSTIKSEQLIKYITYTVATGVIAVATTYLSGLVKEKINLGVRTKLWNKIMHLPSKFYDTDDGGALVSRVTTDTDVSHYYFTFVLDMFAAFYAGIVALCKLFDYQSTLAMWILLIIPIMAFVGIFYCIFTNYAGNKAKQCLSEMMGYLHEHVRNFRLIKATVSEQSEVSRAKPYFNRQYKADFLLQFSSSLEIIAMEIVSCISIAISFIIGGEMVNAGIITTGKLIGVYTLSGMLSVRIAQIFSQFGMFSQYNGTLKHVADIMEQESEPVTGSILEETSEDIRFEHVEFAYHRAPVLKDVSFVIPKGKITAVIGSNGAGKSTLFKLLERMYTPEGGKIIFGDTNINEFNLESWRKTLAIVSQDKPLISGSVRDNILYGMDREVSEDELISIAKKACVYDFIKTTPNGFDAEVGPGGQNFSGGQQQCIAIARAMMRNADYLLLDEATSNLDVKSEQLVTKALDNLMKGRTTIMIAHSYAATLSADKIVVLNNGYVEGEGTPEELLKTNEYYQTFVRRRKNEI